MGEKKPATLFVRRASGLVREMSTTSASFYNIICGVGGALGNSFVIATSIPLFVVTIGMWSIPGYSVGMALFYVLALVLVAIFVCLVSVMPRTGGDYVFTTRTTSPFVGWLEGWGMLWMTLGFIGTNMLFVCWGLSSLTEIGVAVWGFTSWTPWVAWWSGLLGMVTVTIISIAFIMLQHLIPARIYFRSYTYLVLISFVMILLSFPLLVGASPATLDAAFQHFSGMTPQTLATQAATAGATYVPFTMGSLGVALATGLFMYIGFQFSVYFAGELKGNVSKNTVIAVLAGLTCVALVNSLEVAVVFGMLGWGGTLTNWGYLFWTGTGPFNGVWPSAMFLAAILQPSWAWLAAVAAFGGIITNVLILSAWSALISRLVFAWSMDRVIPSWFAGVNARTKSPLRIILLACVGIFILATLTALGADNANAIWFTVVMSILTWFMPGFNAILLPFRRKDLFELAPSWARRKILGVYVLPVLGVIWVLFMFWSYIVSFVAPFVSAVTSAGLSGFAGYAISTGIAGVILTTVVGAIVWFVSKWHNKKRGIAFADIFTQLPPE